MTLGPVAGTEPAAFGPAYDLAGRTTGISDTAGHSLTYGFDTAKRVTSATQTAPNFAGSRVVSYLLDPNGNKARATWADGYYVTYGFDPLNRVITATENGTFLLATYLYDALSRRTSLVYGNGAAQGYTYSTQGDLLTLGSTLSGTSNTYTNTFTKAHQVASEDASNSAWRFVPALFQTTAYAAANNLNQYVNITVGANPAVTMAYDGNGNLTGDGVWTFAYDAKNMLRTAAKSGTAASYVYDPLGRRQAKTVNATVTTFLADGDEEIADYSGTTVLRRYVPGPGTDMPIAVVTPGAPNTRAYFHTNRQGSTVAMSNDAGTVSEGPYTYDAYGNGPPMTGVAFKYTGRRLDAETGLYYYRARYYAPNLGRFLQTDPVGYADQMNLYTYVANDPLNGTDPTGLCFDNCPVSFSSQYAIKANLIAQQEAGRASGTGAIIGVGVGAVIVSVPVSGAGVLGAIGGSTLAGTGAGISLSGAVQVYNEGYINDPGQVMHDGAIGGVSGFGSGTMGTVAKGAGITGFSKVGLEAFGAGSTTLLATGDLVETVGASLGTLGGGLVAEKMFGETAGAVGSNFVRVIAKEATKQETKKFISREIKEGTKDIAQDCDTCDNE